MSQSRGTFGTPFSYPQILGGYLAVNAIPDSCMLVDSADCATLRAEVISDNHDWNSSLIMEDGRYRIASTGVSPDSIVMDRKEQLADFIRKLDSESWGVLLVYPAPITSMLGIDYNGIIQGMGPLNNLILDARPVDTLGDWLAGYRELVELLARRLPLDSGEMEPDSVGIVGYLYDRNEGDHRANVQEMERLLAMVGLDVASIWLSGKPTAHLARISRASTLIALPGGEEAARILAERTGAAVVKARLPVGPRGTLEWLKEILRGMGREDTLSRELLLETRKVYELLTKPVLGVLSGHTVVLAGEPVLTVGLVDLLKEFGMDVAWAAVNARIPLPKGHEKTLVVPDLGVLRDAMETIAASPVAPLLIGNERAMAVSRGLEMVPVSLGFQSGGIHELLDAPFLGLKGTLNLVQKMANAVTLYTMRK